MARSLRGIQKLHLAELEQTCAVFAMPRRSPLLSLCLQGCGFLAMLPDEVEFHSEATWNWNPGKTYAQNFSE